MTQPDLYLAPTTDTALRHLGEQVGKRRGQNHLVPIHLLLPSRAVNARVRSALGDNLNVHYWQIYKLGRAVLQAARRPVYELNDTAIRRLVHHLLREMAHQGALSTFLPVWDKPGFTNAMVAWLREMKSQGIDPAQVRRHADQSGRERDRQLAELYQRYQDFLQKSDTSDADGLLWLAAETLENDSTLFQHLGPLFVLGFDQFTPIQLRILAQLVKRYDHAGVYLTWDAERQDDSLALTRLAHTRCQLQETLKPSLTYLDPPAADGVDAALLHLRRTLFEPLDPTQRPDPGQAIRLVEAPSREEEVRWALRSIKKLLLDGVPYKEIALAAPAPSSYQRLVETIAEEYGVPVQAEKALATNPLANILLRILSLHPLFPWRQTFQVLRSPYVCQNWLSPEQLDLLDRLTRERPVVAGRDQWRFALRPVSLNSNLINSKLNSEEIVDDEDRSSPPLVASVPEAELAALEAGLTAFFDHCTPPTPGNHRSYVLWIQEAILGLFTDDADPDGNAGEPVSPTLDLLNGCAAGQYPERDLRAIRLVMRMLRQLVTAADLIPDGGEDLPWEAFISDLANILPAATMEPDPHIEAVPFAPLEAYRSLSVDHLFVLGLGEGEFPAPPPPDPLYSPQERLQHPLPLRRHVDGDDACLWWQVVSNCRRQLTLLRPWSDENGAVWPASPYWTEVATRFTNLRPHHIPTAASLEIEEAASHNELLMALGAKDAMKAPGSLASSWRQAQLARDVMLQRNSWREPGIYEGVIQSDDLRQRLTETFGPGRVWSASRLNRYGNCPFGFFAEHVLKLEARKDPEEGLDAAQRGTILHAILERLHGDLARKRIPPAKEHVDEILGLLDAVCDQVFSGAPVRYGFRPGPLWRHEQEELRRLLIALVRWECEQNGAAPGYLPYRQEVAFGVKEVAPITVLGNQGVPFRLRGFIDRVDISQDGRLRIVDYKSGSSKYSSKDVQAGLALQTALYALAAEQLMNAPVSESYYLHIPTREISGKLTFSGRVEASSEVQDAIAAASGFITNIRAGLFPSAPAKPQGSNLTCASWCELAPICRVTRHSRTQGKRLLEQKTEARK